jgi:hypothetical protein
VRIDFTREVFVRAPLPAPHPRLPGLIVDRLTFDPSVGMLGSNVYTKAIGP